MIHACFVIGINSFYFIVHSSINYNIELGDCELLEEGDEAEVDVNNEAGWTWTTVK